MPARRNERGNSTISNIFWLVVLAAAAYATWNVVPVYYEHYKLHDKVLELSRQHPHVQGNKDEQLRQKLMSYVNELRMDPYVYQENIAISTRETSRMITVRYAREVQVLPGFKHTFQKVISVDSPFY